MKKIWLLSIIMISISFNSLGKLASHSDIQDINALANKHISTIDPLEMDHHSNSIGCTAYTEYHSSGQIKEVGCQGYFKSKGTPFGSVYEYDESGKLIRMTYYHPDEFGQDYKIVKEYDDTGSVILQKIFNNDALYEVDEKELTEIPMY